ncbi:hypothetical protein [Lysinibacter cavernae]|uniref:Uncharacterized protein n=1 Tax=Lysinibacter cavernae TaxID=1640652 RepID=A0A7X5R0X8_9MICO|nr:hypothetical protein [Lysinibacter cavernae]NIH53613.1 hypothetical protein [Lysinibacter cavernae]
MPVPLPAAGRRVEPEALAGGAPEPKAARGSAADQAVGTQRGPAAAQLAVPADAVPGVAEPGLEAPAAAGLGQSEEPLVGTAAEEAAALPGLEVLAAPADDLQRAQTAEQGATAEAAAPVARMLAAAQERREPPAVRRVPNEPAAHIPHKTCC